jgi:protease-4
MDLDRVSEIAEGRVWLGARAKELGLVDSLGDEASAIAKAAGLAGLEAYGVRRIEVPLTPREMLLQQLTGVEALEWTTSWLEGSSGVPLLRQVGRAWEFLRNLDDPRHSYALCLVCEVRGP